MKRKNKTKAAQPQTAFYRTSGVKQSLVESSAPELYEKCCYFVYRIEKQEIETCDTRRLIHDLRCEADNPLVQAGPGSVIFAVEGYGDSLQDVITIPAFRAFASKLQIDAPCWLYFALPGGAWPFTIFCASGPEILISDLGPKGVHFGINRADVERFLAPQLREYRKLCKMAHVDQNFADIHLQVVTDDSFPNLPPIGRKN